MKTTIKNLKRIIRNQLREQLLREAPENTSFCACVYMGEGEEILSFFTGPKKACTAKATKMAQLLETGITSLDKLATGDFDTNDGCTLVLPAGDPEIKGECISVVEKSSDNAYGADHIMFNYPDSEGGFEPVKKSQFKVGEPIIFARFVGNVPGGWHVVDTALTRVEYWQLGEASDEEYNDEEVEDRDEEEFARAKQTLKGALGISPEDQGITDPKKRTLN